MRSTGIAAPASLGGASDHTLMAVSAIDAAAQRVWFAARWDWRCFWVPFELDPSEQALFYRLPDRYSETAADPVCSYLGDAPLYHEPYQDLIFRRPTIDIVPFDQMLAGMGLSATAVWLDFLSEDENTGAPRYWGIQGSSLYLYPVLDEDTMEELDDSLSKLPISFNFYASYQSLMNADLDSGADILIEIPDKIMHIIHHLALGYFQADLEYPGAGQNEGRGERMLNKEVAGHRKLKRDSARFTPTGNRRAW